LPIWLRLEPTSALSLATLPVYSTAHRSMHSMIWSCSSSSAQQK
jgi:hypothetical protein